MSDIFYQYKTLQKPIELVIKPINNEIKFSGNILNFYEDEKNDKLSIKITAKVSDIKTILPELLQDESKYLDLILLVKSVKSIFRKCYIFEKNESIYKSELILHKKDWRSDIELSAILILKKDIKEYDGYASSKGTQLGWSSSYKIYFDKPEEKSGGASMDIKWESFSGPKLFWLNDHYSKDVYTLDIPKGNKMPKIYLNTDIDPHLKSLIEEKSTKLSTLTSSRDLMFQTISNSIFTQLLTDCIIEFNNHLKDYSDSEASKDIAIESAWEELPECKKQMIENYSHKILPGSRKKDSLENLKELIYDEKDAISEISRKILNIAQNSSEHSTQKVFTEHAKLLLRKEKRI